MGSSELSALHSSDPEGRQRGRTLKQVIDERDQLTARAGYYHNIEHLSLRDADPMKYERFYSRLHSSVLAAREVARFLAANPGSREMGESLWALLTPEGDTLAMSTGFISHTAAFPFAIRYMADNAYDDNPGIDDGDVFCTDDGFTAGAPHPGDTYNYIAIKIDDEIVGWAVGLNHIMEAGGAQAGGWPTFCADTFADGLVFPPMKTGQNLRQAVWFEKLWERRTRSPILNVLDDKMRTAGCAMIHKAVHEIVAEFGLDYFRRAAREVLEESRRMVVDNIQTLMVPGRYNGCSFRAIPQKGWQKIWTTADRDFLIHIRESLEVRADGGIHVDFEGSSKPGAHAYNGYPGGVNCALFLSMTSTFMHNTKPTGAINQTVSANYPKGSIYNPENGYAAYSNKWNTSMMMGNMVFSMLIRSQFMRGYLEECFVTDSAYDAIQGGGALADGTVYGFANFEWIGAAARGAFCYRDGDPVSWAEWVALTNIGNAEEFEYLIPPLFYVGRKLVPGYFGHGRFRGGPGASTVHWVVEPGQSLEVSRMSASTAHVTSIGLGMNGGYPAPGHFHVTAHDTNVREIVAVGGHLPRDARELLEFIDAGKLKAGRVEILKADNAPLDLKDGDLWASAGGCAGGWGDPLEREPQMVADDINAGMVERDFAECLYGVVTTLDARGKCVADTVATAARRTAIRDVRRKAKPVADWWAGERERVVAGYGWIDPVADMYRDCMSFPKFDREMREFWQLPDSFKI